MCFSTVLVLISDIPLYLWLVWFGTGSCFWICPCTYGWSGSALITIPRISPVLYRLLVRHCCSFLDIPLYSQPLRFGTRATFRNITCTHSHFGSALAPFSRISPVLYRLLVRHGCSFPNIPLYPYPILFGTRAIFQNLTCTHDDFVRHWLSFSDMPCTLQLR